MGREITERAVVSIRSATQGTKELETIISFEVKKSDPKTAVKVMSKKRRAIGYSHGVAEFTATATVVYYPKEHEVDWVGIMLSAERFGLTYERNGDGIRMSCLDVVVNNVSEPFDKDGASVFTVEMMYLDEKEE